MRIEKDLGWIIASQEEMVGTLLRSIVITVAEWKMMNGRRRWLNGIRRDDRTGALLLIQRIQFCDRTIAKINFVFTGFVWLKGKMAEIGLMI